MNDEIGYSEAAAAALRATGECDDAQFDDSTPQTAPPAEETRALSPAEAAYKAWKPWDDIEKRAYVREVNLQAAEQPLGLIKAERWFREGIISGADIEAIRELSGTPKDFVLSAPDTEAAMDLIAQYVEHEALNETEAAELAQSIALREERLEIEAQAQFVAEQKQAQEADEVAARKEKIRSDIWDKYYAVKDRLQNVSEV